MAEKQHNPKYLAQNFLRSPGLVRSLVKASSISATDTIYEIGPGHGMITAQLARLADRVIAIEVDPLLAGKLQERFLHAPNVQIVEGDFLRYRIRDQEYKIFANIPYNITSEIVRKILYLAPCPSEAYLIMQKEAAEKFAGVPRETQFSVLAKPLYSLQIARVLTRTDFYPVPRVESVLLRIQKRCPPLMREKDMSLYRSFVHYGFGRWRRSLKLAFKPLFTYNQWKRLSRDLCISLKATPSELSIEQWLGLFGRFKQIVLQR
jgi:23S rRNA (adenine-N6)-dimethyltransferase